MTAAATENNSTLPEPRSSDADDWEDARAMPPRAPNDEHRMNAVTLMWSTSMPARCAASALPPVAYRWRPQVVLLSAIVHRIIRVIAMTAAHGMPAMTL